MGRRLHFVHLAKNYRLNIRMGSVGCLAKGDIFFWQKILKNRSKYTGDISEESVVCTVLISAIIIEIFNKNIQISYIIPYKKFGQPAYTCMSKKVPHGEVSLGIEILMSPMLSHPKKNVFRVNLVCIGCLGRHVTLSLG